MNENQVTNQLEAYTSQSQSRNDQLKAQLARIQQQVEQGATQEVQELRGALGAAKEKLIEQHMLLKQLTSNPLVLATVLRVQDNSPDPSQYKVGMKVKILKGDRNEGQSGKLNTTVDKRGRIQIELESGYTFTYQATNTKPSQLELESNGSKDPRSFKVGAVVRVTLPGKRSHGWTGTITAQYESNGQVLVQFKPGFEDYYYVGFPIYIQPAGLPNGTAIVVFEGKHFEVLLPEDKPVNAGDTVKLNTNTMQIVDLGSAVYAGEVSIVRRAIDDKTTEVEYQGATRVVLNGKLSAKPEAGDRVVLDSSATVIGLNLGKDDERFSFTMETHVSWNDIGGLKIAKKQMIEAIELPFRYPDIYKHYGKKPIKGVLLYGPPGCGKTMLGKATATALADLHNGKSTATGFIYVKGPEILDRFVGTAEATIRSIFQRSRKHKETYGYPAVIFIDEADAILGKRGMGISSDIERTIVPQFLAEMDGLEDSGAVILLATNRADILDPAIVRDGRVDRKIKITRPDMDGARDIFMLYLKKMPLCNGYTHNDLADMGALELFSDKRVLYSIQLNGNHKGQTRNFTLGNLASGAMVAGIVDQATSIALHRDIEKGAPQGLAKDDITKAVDCVFQENFDLNHTDDLADFVHDFKSDVIGIQKLRQGAGAIA